MDKNFKKALDSLAIKLTDEDTTKYTIDNECILIPEVSVHAENCDR